MIGRMVAVPAALAILAAAPAMARSAKTPEPGAGRHGTLVVVPAGAEDSLKFDDMLLGRPFGAELVDRLEIGPVFRLGGTDVYLVKGRRGAGCPARFVLVAVDRRRTPTVSEPFGTCRPLGSAAVEQGRLVMTMPDADGRPRRFTYANGAIERAAAAPTPGAARSAIPACRLYRQAGAAGPTEAERLLASFRADYPEALRERGKVERATLAPADLRALVTGLACLATWPGAEPLVPETAAPLFASKRYGGQAFAWLDALGRGPATDESMRAAARGFAAQMYFQISRF